MQNHNSFEDIFDHFEKFVSFSKTEKDDFRSLLIRQELVKGSMITMPDSVENYLTFLSSGITRGYIINNHNESTYSINFPGSFISSYGSFTQRFRSKIGVEALTDVVVFRMKYEDLQILYGKSKEGEKMGRLAAEHACALLESRILSFLSMSAAERYEFLLNSQPELILQVPQKYLAEYLGIQPESLSRIKRQIKNSPIS